VNTTTFGHPMSIRFLRRKCTFNQWLGNCGWNSIGGSKLGISLAASCRASLDADVQCLFSNSGEIQ
jgi:hypothetical protein